jgi:hypothetical protein
MNVSLYSSPDRIWPFETPIRWTIHCSLIWQLHASGREISSVKQPRMKKMRAINTIPIMITASKIVTIVTIFLAAFNLCGSALLLCISGFHTRSLRAGHARHTDSTLNVITHNHTLSLWAVNADILQLDILTLCTRATLQINDGGASLPAARSADVDESDITDVDLGRILFADVWLDVDVTLIQDNGIIRVANCYVLVRDIFDVPVSNFWTCPSLQARSSLPIEKRDVFDVRVGDVVQSSWILAYRAHRNTVSIVAPYIFDVYICRVRFWRNTVVAHIKFAICYFEAIDIQCVKSISILG